MKQVILKSLSLSEWKAKNIFVQFDEHSTKISGENQVGKSSLIHAFTWLLTSRTEPHANANSEIFDNRVPLSPDTPTASVTAIVSIDGYDYEIKRTAKAKFTRPRNSAEWVKSSSDEYHTYIDNIEYSATDFGNWVSQNICNTEHIIYALDGSFFTFLCEDNRDKARKVLESIVGEITIADFKGDYSVILDKLSRYPIENIEEQTKNGIKPLNRRLEDIPALIADKERTLAEYEGVDYDALLAEIESKKQEVARIDDEILGNSNAYAPIIEERNRLLQAISDMQEKMRLEKNAYDVAHRGIVAGINADIAIIRKENGSIIAENASAQRQFDILKSRLVNAETQRDFYAGKIEGLRVRRNAIMAKTFDGSTTCAYCGQELPDTMIEDAIAKFNEAKVRELESIATEGRKCKELLESYTQEVADLQAEIDKGVVVRELHDTSVLENSLNQTIASHKPFEETERYEAFMADIEAVRASIPELPQSNSVELTHKKRDIMDELDTLNRRYGLKFKADEIRADIANLQAERREVACEIARLEGIIAKCKEYVEERADIISHRVNDRLEGCKVVMYSTQKDGNIKPDCVITDLDGVKYSTLSNSARLRANLQMSRLFRAHHNIELPYFIDEASVYDSSHRPTFENTQNIYLFASDSKTLKVEKYE